MTIETILLLAESYLRFSAQGTDTIAGTGRPGRMIISAENGVVAPLLFLALKCGDPLVVSRAMALLDGPGRKEGLYDAGVSLSIAQKMLALGNAKNTGGDQEAPENKMGTAQPSSIEFANVALINKNSGNMDRLASALGVS